MSAEHRTELRDQADKKAPLLARPRRAASALADVFAGGELAPVIIFGPLAYTWVAKVVLPMYEGQGALGKLLGGDKGLREQFNRIGGAQYPDTLRGVWDPARDHHENLALIRTCMTWTTLVP